MILADKIILLRKKAGWSQEELAEQLNVTRQSVSKWEGAQSIPDMNKILLMSRIFGVTTDYLLKDEIGEPEYTETDGDIRTVRRVSMEEALEFLRLKAESAKLIALATFLCIISPVCLLVLGAASETGRISLSENAAGGLGMITLFLIVAAAAAIFIAVGTKTKKFEFLDTEAIETEYGVNGMVRERKHQFRHIYTKFLVLGTVFCILSVIPIFITIIFTEDDFYMVLTIAALLFLAAVGCVFFLLASIPHESMMKLLQEGDYTERKKNTKRIGDSFSAIYWLIVVAAYLAYSFHTNAWEHSWCIFAIAGVLYGAVATIVNIVNRSEKKK